jgi:hypothetical protein
VSPVLCTGFGENTSPVPVTSSIPFQELSTVPLSASMIRFQSAGGATVATTACHARLDPPACG